MALIEMRAHQFVGFDFPVLFLPAEMVSFRELIDEANDEIRVFSPYRKLIAYENEQFSLEGFEISAEMLPVNVVQLRVRILFTPRTELEQSLLEDLNNDSRDNIQRYLTEFRQPLFGCFTQLLSQYIDNANVLDDDQVHMFDDANILVAHGELLQETQPRICSDSFRLLKGESRSMELRLL